MHIGERQFVFMRQKDLKEFEGNVEFFEAKGKRYCRWTGALEELKARVAGPYATDFSDIYLKLMERYDSLGLDCDLSL